MGAVISLFRSFWALSYAAFSLLLLAGTVVAITNVPIKNQTANKVFSLLLVQVSDLPFLGILSQILFYTWISISGTSRVSTLATLFNYFNFITIIGQLYLFKRSFEAKEAISKFLVKISLNESNPVDLLGPDSLDFWKIALYPRIEPKEYTLYSEIPYWTLNEQRSAMTSDGWQSVLQMGLDVYKPNSVEGGDDRPVYVHIHGGGWTSGSKTMIGPILSELISRRWIVVSIDYRTNTKAGYPTQFLDCKRAMRWVKDQIRIFGGNPANIVVGGDSAGGHLAALLALTPNIPEYQPGFEDVDTTVQGCVPQSAVLDTADINNYGPRNSRTRFVNEVSRREGPPESEEKSEAHISYLEIPHGEHASSAFPSVPALHIAKATAEWLSQNFDKKRANGESKIGVHELVDWEW
ncbi:hypothetical protein BGZ76_004624 [Entomortierella beljakovae]|nr:hypothetical protein BGZ76_004624 [Entomortierella beljakovae]